MKKLQKHFRNHSLRFEISKIYMCSNKSKPNLNLKSIYFYDITKAFKRDWVHAFDTGVLKCKLFLFRNKSHI